MTPTERKRYEASLQEAAIATELMVFAYKARTGSGISQKELARRVGVSPSMISRIENGVQIPGLLTLHRIAFATGEHLDLRFGELASAE